MKLIAVVAWIAFLPCGLEAQADGTPRVRQPIGANLGVLWYEGGEDQCSPGIGIGLATEVRTTGRLLVAATLEGFLANPMSCTDDLRTVQQDAELLGVWTGVDYPPGVRLGGKVGWMIAARPVRIEPTVQVGFMRGRHDYFPDDEWNWKPWIGAGVGLRPRAHAVQLNVEYVRHRVGTRYQKSIGEVVREFDQGEHWVRLGIGF